MSLVDDERTRLELLNTQLEMEASTFGEYVTLFTHRRAAAARRARAREQLLQRLVQDRRRLRARLHDLLGMYDESYTKLPVDSNLPTTEESDGVSDSIAKGDYFRRLVLKQNRIIIQNAIYFLSFCSAPLAYRF